jgi:inner membrane protein
MQGPSHLMISWFFADASRLDSPNERRIVAWSGLAPDIDVLAYGGAILWYGLDKDLAFENVWRVVHHRYTHGMSFVLLTGIFAWLLSSGFAKRHTNAGAAAAVTDVRAWRVALLAMLASALHNFCDVVGGGPTWPVYPLWPLSDLGWTANWSWTLSEWPNTVILFSCLAATMLYARFGGRSPMELFGGRADRWFVGVVQRGSDHEVAASTVHLPPSRRRVPLRVIIWVLVVLISIALLAPLGFRPDS